MKISHIVNPFKTSGDSDSYDAQQITFETMQIAKDFAQNCGLNVNLYSAQFPEDHPIIPNYYIKTRDLNRSVLDLHSFKVGYQ